ncbi:TonB-dependent receptor [Pedobacter sp. GR22-10]|uniref:TonB-dependent receptor n=1 Tax=Pedobacter sp. GR22-10 TaxID=2994472 RepID=UPI00224690D2|nr:TonB-dependent receptor [Pedobacter sp. GR22-10]MCX2431544.1 TonB-dependent receptor [Pedobacter sp. GR22-10]
MKKSLLIIVLISLNILRLHAQNVKVEGYVKDNKSEIPYVTISFSGQKVQADSKGYYAVYIKSGIPFILSAQAVGYKAFTKNVLSLSGDTIINIGLDPVPNKLDDVVISTSRKPEDVKNITTSVSIVNKEKLSREMAINPDLSTILANQVPGFAPTAQTGNNVGQNLRGRPMLVMIDGVSQSSPLRNAEVDLRSIDPSVLERIEVVKGATAIYGNGAAGGLVNYITMVPDTAAKFAGKTQVNLNGSIVKVKNSAGGRINQMFYGKLGKFDYVISGMYEQTGEYKDAKGDVVGPNYSLGETDSYNAFTKIGYVPAMNQRIQFTYNTYSSLQNSNFTLVNGNLATGQKATGVLGKPLGIPTGVDYNHNLHLSYKIDSIFLQSSLNADVYYETRKDVFYVSLGRFDGGDGQSLARNDKKGARLFLETPLLNFNFLKASIAYGADFMKDKTAQPLVDGRIWVPTMDMTNVAPFAQVDFNILHNLVFKTGLRYENVAIAVDDYRTLRTTGANNTTITPSFDVKGGNLKYSTYLFNAGLRYNKFNIFSPFVGFSQGFSVMDIGLALRDAKVNSIDKINTDAVKVNNYEAGFESRIGGLILSASAYISTSKLGIEVVYDPVTGLFNTARSPEKIYGFELAANYRLFESLGLSASYSYTEGKRDIDKNGQYNDAADLYLNGRRIAAPKVTASLTYSPLKVLDLTMNFTGIGSRNRFEKNSNGVYNGNEGEVRAYNLFSFAGIYQVKKNTKLSLGVDNIFNQDYFPARAQWFMQPGFYSKGRGTSVNFGISVSY